jgi:hypothetical protein
MTYSDAKRELIEAICKNPAGFLMDQFKPGGAFADSGRTLGDIINTPVIMQVSNNEHVRLSVLFWDVNIESYASYVDRARTMETETGKLVWGNYELARRPYTWQSHVEEFTHAVAIGDATYEWADIQGQVNLCPSVPYYAWFFPLGAKAAREHPGLTMYASNRPNL